MLGSMSTAKRTPHSTEPEGRNRKPTDQRPEGAGHDQHLSESFGHVNPLVKNFAFDGCNANRLARTIKYHNPNRILMLERGEHVPHHLFSQPVDPLKLHGLSSLRLVPTTPFCPSRSPLSTPPRSQKLDQASFFAYLPLTKPPTSRKRYNIARACALALLSTPPGWGWSRLRPASRAGKHPPEKYARILLIPEKCGGISAIWGGSIRN